MSAPTKHDRAVAAAAELFLRHGFARTTMGDIAKAASMSRPALYLLFPNKEEVFEATVLHLNTFRMEEIRRGLIGVDGLANQLFVATDLWLVAVYGLQRDTPDSRDMDDLSIPVVQTVYGQLQDLLAELLTSAGQGRPLPASADELARLLLFAIRGFGAVAGSEDELRHMARLHIQLFCAGLSAG
jgi:AcrR family transcriptional regulator